MDLRETYPASWDDFPLAWRWIGARRDTLAPPMTSVRLLTQAAAASIAPEAASRCEARRTAEWAATIVAEDDHLEVVQARLTALGVGDATPVLVSWDRETALETTWAVFVAHWPAFCYPSSDDVTVWSPEASWTLCYRHFQLFEFGDLPPAA